MALVTIKNRQEMNDTMSRMMELGNDLIDEVR
jgi:hypothetical protein